MLRPEGKVEIVDYDSNWPEQFARIAARLREVLGPTILSLEHVGSTAVPSLAAKPVIDVNMVVRDSSREDAYAPALEAADYTLTVREPNWFEHRMFEGQGPRTNLHVFSLGCPEVERMRLFRDWLRYSQADRELYAKIKRQLSLRDWGRVQDYADAKQDVVGEIMARAKVWAGRDVMDVSGDE
jgi:GrpB-like predicted nucleotidyltransferase (UPF0157 family)